MQYPLFNMSAFYNDFYSHDLSEVHVLLSVVAIRTLLGQQMTLQARHLRWLRYREGMRV